MLGLAKALIVQFLLGQEHIAGMIAGLIIDLQSDLKILDVVDKAIGVCRTKVILGGFVGCELELIAVDALAKILVVLDEKARGELEVIEGIVGLDAVGFAPGQQQAEAVIGLAIPAGHGGREDCDDVFLL